MAKEKVVSKGQGNGLLNKTANFYKKVKAARGAYKEKVLKAKADRDAAKGIKFQGKAEYAKAKSAARRTKYRAAAFASAATAKYNAEKEANKARLNALSEWNAAIANNAQPADGTGNPSKGDSKSGGSTDTNEEGTYVGH